MKKILLLLLLSSINVLEAQTNISFSNFDIGLYGGINFESSSEIRGSIILEFKTNLNEQLKIKVSSGYLKTVIPDKYDVKTYGVSEIDNKVIYSAESFQVLKKDYDFFPVTFGLQYLISQKSIIPYLITEFSYNFIIARTIRSPGFVWSYNTFDEIPEEFRFKHSVNFPDNSYSIGLGTGFMFDIGKSLKMDIRYMLKLDSEIKNTHNITVGVNL